MALRAPPQKKLKKIPLGRGFLPARDYLYIEPPQEEGYRTITYNKNI